MNILSFDTSGDTSSISSKLGDDLLSFQISHQRKERPDWENFLNHIGIFSNEDIKRFDLLVFGRGPGSYTAIRSSATFLKAISHTNKIPLMAVSNMESLAYKYFQNNKTTDDISVLINSDIQDEFFYGKFNFNKKGYLYVINKKDHKCLKSSTCSVKPDKIITVTYDDIKDDIIYIDED